MHETYTQADNVPLSKFNVSIVLHVTPRDFYWRIPSGTSVERTQGVNSFIIHKMGFYGNFSPISIVYQTIYCQSKLKTRYLRFSSYFSLGRLDLNNSTRLDHWRITAGRCVPAEVPWVKFAKHRWKKLSIDYKG